MYQLYFISLSQLAAKAGVGCTDVKNVIIWGNHSSTQFPDVAHAQIKKGSDWVPASKVVQDDAWANQEFVTVRSLHCLTIVHLIALTCPAFGLQVKILLLYIFFVQRNK